MKHPVAVSVAAFIMVLLVILWLSVALVLGAAEPRSSLVLPTVVSVVALALSAVATMLMPMDVMILGMAVKDRPAALVVFVDVAYVAVAVGAALLWLSIPGLYVAQAMAEEEEDLDDFDKADDQARFSSRGARCRRRCLPTATASLVSALVLFAVAGVGAALFASGATEGVAKSHATPAWLKVFLAGHTWWTMALCFLLGMASLASMAWLVAYTALGMALVPLSDLIHQGVRGRRERERERDCVCVCECVIRERERERESVRDR